MRSSERRSRARATKTGLAFAALVAMLATIATPSPAAAQATDQEQYQVRLVYIEAIDETGADWLGSDEVYGRVTRTNDRTGTGVSMYTNQFGDFDTGDIKYLEGTQNCIGTVDVDFDRRSDGVMDAMDGDRWYCFRAQVAGGFTLDADLYEADASHPSIPFEFDDRGIGHPVYPRDLSDDLIGRGSLQLSGAELRADMPDNGDSEMYSLRLSGDGSYELTFLVIRITPPRLGAIAL